MTRIAGLVALAGSILAVVPTASAARCPNDCKHLLKTELRTCRAACPKRRPGKPCRSGCFAAFKVDKATCKAATNPTPPDCGRTTTTTTTTTSTSASMNMSSSTSTTLANGNTATLTLKNYLSWCSVSVNGGAASTASTRTLPFPKNTVVSLDGDKANSTFVFGYWVGTAGDTGPSHDTAMATTVTMDGNRTAQACCPFASSPNTPCPPP